jgi:tripartite-type tricarboxylate transporter receptor subunit TctC
VRQNRTISRFVLAALLTNLVAVLADAAQAQRLSDRPIFLTVPFTPGTGPDLLARIIGEELRQRWGQTVVVDNKPGASGNIGTLAAARAAPDGHTLLMTVNTFVMNASLFKAVPYDPQKSFVPIAEIATGALALVVHPSLSATSVTEFISAAKARPDEINYASPGRGTPQHLAMELFKLTTKTNLRHIPYPGSAGAVRDLVGGQVQAMFLPVHTALPLAEAKQIRILAVGSERRVAQAPDVPTLAEQGVAGFDVDLWYAILAPAGTPQPMIERYNAVMNEILAEPNVRAALEKQGLIPAGGPPERLADLIARDQRRWADVIRDAGITPE